MIVTQPLASGGTIDLPTVAGFVFIPSEENTTPDFTGIFEGQDHVEMVWVHPSGMRHVMARGVRFEHYTAHQGGTTFTLRDGETMLDSLPPKDIIDRARSVFLHPQVFLRGLERKYVTRSLMRLAFTVPLLAFAIYWLVLTLTDTTFLRWVVGLPLLLFCTRLYFGSTDVVAGALARGMRVRVWPPVMWAPLLGAVCAGLGLVLPLVLP